MGNEQSFVQTKKKKLREIERKEREDKLEEIAQVEFESKLAEGTTATCYKGIWKQKEVAIKQFKEEGEITQFTKELSILSFELFILFNLFNNSFFIEK
jgi:predicted Ser/Thr protein kinase